MIIQGQDSKLIRLLAFFPFVIGLFFGIYALRSNSGFAGLTALIFTGVGIWTLKAQALHIIDIANQTYTTRSNWLWMTWGDSEPLSQFSHIAVIRSDLSVDGSASSTSYDVCLITRAGKPHIFEVFNRQQEALQRADHLAKHTRLPIENK